MNRVVLFACLLALVACIHANGSSSNPSTISLINFKKLFDAQRQQLAGSDLANAFYSIKGSQLLGETQTPQVLQEVCSLVKSKLDKTSIESVFYASSLAKIANCPLTAADVQATLTSSAASKNVADLYFYVNSALNLKQQIDAKKISQSLLDGLKADSSILNQAYALHIAYHLNENEKPFYNNIEDLLDQADEVDKKYLQYDGGVAVTSMVLEGIFDLSEKLKQLPAKFDQARLVKFTNYLITKKYPTNVKAAYFLLRVSLKLTDNKFLIPVVASRLSPIAVSSAQPNLLIGLTNVIGTPIKQVQFTLEAPSSKNQKANGPALFTGKKTFTSKSSDGTTFELKLVEQQVPKADFYTVNLAIVPKVADKRFFLLQNDVEVKVTTVASVSDVEVGVADRDQSTPKLTKLAADNSKLKEKLEADQQSKFYLKFSVKDKTKGTPIESHQAFIRFTHATSKREIVFLAQAAGGQYTADVDFSKNAKNFRFISGVYSVDLVVADALIENPTTVNLVDLKVHFTEEAQVGQDKANLYTKKPEIKHLFRPNEPTPPKVVSLTFAGLCILPLVIMVLLWIKIGFNFSNLSFSLSGIVFHVSLAAIFGLYWCYWTHLNMFQTVKYLTLIGGVALVFGNRLLRSLAAQKEKKN